MGFCVRAVLVQCECIYRVSLEDTCPESSPCVCRESLCECVCVRVCVCVCVCVCVFAHVLLTFACMFRHVYSDTRIHKYILFYLFR